MQKRSSKAYKIEYFPLPLSPDFPVFMDDLDVQTDRDIPFLHYHQCFELGYCHSGSGVFVIENKVLPFHKGCITVISQNERHLAQSAKGTSSTWTWFYFDPVLLVKGLGDDPLCLETGNLGGAKFNNILSREDCPGLRTALLRAIEEMRGEKKFYTSNVRGLVLLIMAELHRHYSPKRKSAGFKTEIARIAPALRLMAGAYDQPLNVRRIAQACGLGATQFRRIFKQSTAQSPLRYLTHLRLQMAASLLTQSARRIIEVSQDVGYPTLSSFNRHFQKQFRMSPRQWRKKNAV